MLDAHFQLGDVRRQQGQSEAAIAAFETVVVRDERHLGALAALADLYEKVGRAADAEKALLRIVRLQPDNAYHQYNLAQFYSRIGEDKKARVAFQRAEAIDPRPKRKMRQLR
jgi:tetratricopeptide (TPR) repeat protein